MNASTKSLYAAVAVGLPGANTVPVAVPGGKPVIVVVAPTLPLTTEVPVLEIVPPISPKEEALPRLIGAAKAGTATATAISVQDKANLTFLRADAFATNRYWNLSPPTLVPGRGTVKRYFKIPNSVISLKFAEIPSFNTPNSISILDL